MILNIIKSIKGGINTEEAKSNLAKSKTPVLTTSHGEGKDEEEEKGNS